CADPTAQLAELPAARGRRADSSRGAACRVERLYQLDQPMEVVRSATPRQCPDVLEPEVARELVDAPRPRSLRRVRESHHRTSPPGNRPRIYDRLMVG